VKPLAFDSQRSLNAARALANFVIKYGVGRSGLLATYLDLRKKQAFGKASIYDLGDCVPFFYWLGQVDNDNKYMEWAEDQTNLAINRAQLPCGIFTSFDADRTEPSRREKMSLLRILDMDDTALGLVLMFELTRRLEYANAAKRYFTGMEKLAAKNGFICTHVARYPNLKVPLSISNYCGVQIEEICRYSDLTGDRTLLTFAEQVADAWLKTSSFTEHGVFTFEPLDGRLSLSSFLMNLFLKLRTFTTMDSAVMFKANTNLVFGLIALYGKTKDLVLYESILKWSDSVQKKMMCGNVFYSVWNAEERSSSMVSLETNHAVIDVLLDMYVNLHREDALEIASKCANAWLERQSDCGLVAEGIKEPVFQPLKKSFCPYSPDTSRLDSQVDFSIVLAKLYELTNNSSYLHASARIIEGILRLHRFNDGYCEFVNLVTKQKSGFTIEIKFFALLIKALLLHYELGRGASIYKNQLLRDLVRDR